jgi:hypothetical protein
MKKETPQQIYERMYSSLIDEAKEIISKNFPSYESLMTYVYDGSTPDFAQFTDSQLVINELEDFCYELGSHANDFSKSESEKDNVWKDIDVSDEVSKYSRINQSQVSVKNTQENKNKENRHSTSSSIITEEVKNNEVSYDMFLKEAIVRVLPFKRELINHFLSNFDNPNKLQGWLYGNKSVDSFIKELDYDITFSSAKHIIDGLKKLYEKYYQGRHHERYGRPSDLSKKIDHRYNKIALAKKNAPDNGKETRAEIRCRYNSTKKAHVDEYSVLEQVLKTAEYCDYKIIDIYKDTFPSKYFQNVKFCSTLVNKYGNIRAIQPYLRSEKNIKEMLTDLECTEENEYGILYLISAGVTSNYSSSNYYTKTKSVLEKQFDIKKLSAHEINILCHSCNSDIQLNKISNGTAQLDDLTIICSKKELIDIENALIRYKNDEINNDKLSSNSKAEHKINGGEPNSIEYSTTDTIESKSISEIEKESNSTDQDNTEYNANCNNEAKDLPYSILWKALDTTGDYDEWLIKIYAKLFPSEMFEDVNFCLSLVRCFGKIRTLRRYFRSEEDINNMLFMLNVSLPNKQNYSLTKAIKEHYHNDIIRFRFEMKGNLHHQFDKSLLSGNEISALEDSCTNKWQLKKVSLGCATLDDLTIFCSRMQLVNIKRALIKNPNAFEDYYSSILAKDHDICENEGLIDEDSEKGSDIDVSSLSEIYDHSTYDNYCSHLEVSYGSHNQYMHLVYYDGHSKNIYFPEGWFDL